jgi:hypothetical protein
VVTQSVANLSVAYLSVANLSVANLSVANLSVVMLNVIILSVVTPSFVLLCEDEDKDFALLMHQSSNKTRIPTKNMSYAKFLFFSRKKLWNFI